MTIGSPGYWQIKQAVVWGQPKAVRQTLRRIIFPGAFDWPKRQAISVAAAIEDLETPEPVR
jgi:hypothetical protein